MSDDYCLTMSTKPELMSRIRKLESELSELKSILAVRNLELSQSRKERDEQAIRAEDAINRQGDLVGLLADETKRAETAEHELRFVKNVLGGAEWIAFGDEPHMQNLDSWCEMTLKDSRENIKRRDEAERTCAEMRKERDALAAENAQLKRYLQGAHQ